MKFSKIVYALAMVLAVSCFVAAAQDSHEHMQGMEMPAKSSDNATPSSTLKPAQGASVKIVSPKPGQLIKGDSVPIEFKLVKGKIGEHVHAYVDGEMAGMFKGSKGTLNGVKPGTHTLELRVTTGDHNTELNATDKVSFTTK
ncbi:MAG: hypothetical protein ACTHMB_24995 [Candidatus Binatia bacterium]